MICPVCEGKGFWKEKVEITAEVKVPGPCTNIDCIDGWHAVKFKRRLHKFGPSNLKHHPRKGRALCPNCKGTGCSRCRGTGLKLVRCQHCGGTDVEWTTKREHRIVEGDTHECLYCHNGHRSACGTLGELLSIALELKEKECEREIENGVGKVLEGLDRDSDESSGG